MSTGEISFVFCSVFLYDLKFEDITFYNLSVYRLTISVKLSIGRDILVCIIFFPNPLKTNQPLDKLPISTIIVNITIIINTKEYENA